MISFVLLDAVKLTLNLKVALRLSTVAAAQMSLKSNWEVFPLCFTSDGSLNTWNGKLLSPAERLKSPSMEQSRQSIVKSVVLQAMLDYRGRQSVSLSELLTYCVVVRPAT